MNADLWFELDFNLRAQFIRIDRLSNQYRFDLLRGKCKSLFSRFS